VPVYIDTSRDGFKITPRLLERYIDKKTKAIVLNYPTNPTGVSYRRKELEEINKVLLKHKVLCISDEVYGDLTYGFNHTAFPTLPKAKDNTVYFNGFSKAYAMTGWRVGFACGPKEIIAAMTKIHQYTIMCVSITSQMAAAEALVSGKRSVEMMKREYDRRRKLMTGELNALGLKCSSPSGAFYIFPSIKCSGLSSMDFSRQLLAEEKVAVVPGTAFGPCGEGFIRISYASSLDNLKEALIRIKRFLEKRR